MRAAIVVFVVNVINIDVVAEVHAIRSIDNVNTDVNEKSHSNRLPGSSGWSTMVLSAVETMATNTTIAGEVLSHSVACVSVPTRGGSTVQLYKVWCLGADVVAEIVGWGDRALKLEAACSRSSVGAGSYAVIGPVGATGEGAVFEVKSDDPCVQYAQCLRQIQTPHPTGITLTRSHGDNSIEDRR